MEVLQKLPMRFDSYITESKPISVVMQSFKIFIVEDDPWYGELLKYHLSLNPDYDVHLYTSGQECLDNLYQNPNVICLDIGLPDITGDQLFKKINATNDSIPVIIISGQEEVSVAISLLKAGVSDYFIKDDNTKDLLWNAIIKIRENDGLKKEVEILKDQLEQKYDFEKSIVGQSASMKRTFSLIEKAIQTNINVSITGETGTGKELIAKAIHFNGPRSKKPFVAVNMAAIPRELVESELFGHEKGAFTGAVARKIGQFEKANGGTIFLDEIAELELSLQSKLLRVLQEREITRVGGTEKVQLDIRIISATHNNLPESVKDGKFRQDLYYRIIGLPVEIPPLRDRENEILILSKYFAEEFANSNNLKPISFSEKAREKLMKYNYPGNVRELKAIIDLACVMCEKSIISDSDIVFTSVNSDVSFINDEKTLKEYNQEIIKQYLKKYDNKVLLVAKKLDVGKSTIYKMIQNQEI